MQIKMNTQKAMRLIALHKEEHQKEYALQLEGWKHDMEKFSLEMKEWVNNGGIANERPKEPYKPTDFSEDYDNLMELLVCHEEELITLTESDFNYIVKDEFRWKGQFLLNSTTYIK